MATVECDEIKSSYWRVECVKLKGRENDCALKILKNVLRKLSLHFRAINEMRKKFSMWKSIFSLFNPLDSEWKPKSHQSFSQRIAPRKVFFVTFPSTMITAFFFCGCKESEGRTFQIHFSTRETRVLAMSGKFCCLSARKPSEWSPKLWGVTSSNILNDGFRLGKFVKFGGRQDIEWFFSDKQNLIFFNQPTSG